MVQSLAVFKEKFPGGYGAGGFMRLLRGSINDLDLTLLDSVQLPENKLDYITQCLSASKPLSGER